MNLVRIAPPSSRMELVSAPDSELRAGSRVTVQSIQAGIRVRLEAEVVAIQPPSFLQDRQVKGPFARWVHSHRFESVPEGTRLTDDVEYDLPLGPLGSLVMRKVVARDLAMTFEFRQEATRRLLESDHP